MIKVPSFSCIFQALAIGTGYFFSDTVRGRKCGQASAQNYRHMYQYSTGFCSAEIGLNP